MPKRNNSPVSMNAVKTACHIQSFDYKGCNKASYAKAATARKVNEHARKKVP